MKLNLLRNKFGLLTEQIKANVKGKLNSSFPEGQFRVPRFSYLFCRDVASLVRATIIFVNDHISSKLLALEAAPIQSLFIELNFCKKE